MWGFESPPGHKQFSLKNQIRSIFFNFNVPKIKEYHRIKKAKNSLFLAYVRIHKGEK